MLNNSNSNKKSSVIFIKSQSSFFIVIQTIRHVTIAKKVFVDIYLIVIYNKKVIESLNHKLKKF